MLILLGVVIIFLGLYVSYKIRWKLLFFISVILGGLILLGGVSELTASQSYDFTTTEGQVQAVVLENITQEQSQTIENLSESNENNSEAALNTAKAEDLGKWTDFLQRSAVGAAGGMFFANVGVGGLLLLVCFGGVLAIFVLGLFFYIFRYIVNRIP